MLLLYYEIVIFCISSSSYLNKWKDNLFEIALNLLVSIYLAVGLKSYFLTYLTQKIIYYQYIRKSEEYIQEM